MNVHLQFNALAVVINPGFSVRVSDVTHACRKATLILDHQAEDVSVTISLTTFRHVVLWKHLLLFVVFGWLFMVQINLWY